MRYTLYILILFISLNYNTFSAIFTTAQAGDFNNVATWVGGSVPTSVDDAIIEHNVFVGFNSTIAGVRINNGGILRSSNPSVNLTITGNFQIQAGGEFRGIDGGNNLNLVFNGTTSFTNNGTISFKNITVNTNRTLTLNSSIPSTLLNTSTININGTLNCQTNTIDLDALSIFNLNSGATLQTAVANGVQATITGTGTENFNANASYIFSTGCTNTGFGSITEVYDLGLDGTNISTCTSMILNGGFRKVNTGGSFNLQGQSTTFTMNGAVNSDGVSGIAVNVDYLKINATLTIGSLSIYEILEIAPGATLSTWGGRNFSIGNNAQIIANGTLNAWNMYTGTGNITSGDVRIQRMSGPNGLIHTSGTFTISGPTGFDTGSATFSNFAVTGAAIIGYDIYIEGDYIVTNSMTSNPGVGSVTMQGGNIYGGGTIDINDLIIEGATTLSNTNITLEDLILTNGTFDIQNNAITIENTLTRTSGFLDLSDASSVFNLQGTGAISLPVNCFVANSFGTLNLTRNGTVTANNNYTINNTLTLNNTGLTFDNQNYYLTINGALNNTSGALDLTDDASTIELGGTGALTMPSLINSECGNLNLTRNGTVTLSNNLAVDGTLTLNNAGLVFDVQANTLTINNPLVSTNGSLDLTDNNSTLNLAFNGVTSFSNGAFLSGEVGNLTITGASTITLGSNADIDGAFTLNNANAIFDIDAYRFRLGGNLNYTAGTIDGTDASSTLSFAGTSPVTYNAGAFVNFGTIGNLELLQSNTITQVGEVNVSNDFYVNNAGLYYDAQANVFNLSGDLFYTAGILDFTDTNSEFKITSGNPFTLDGDNFVNNQIGNFKIERNGLVTLSSDLEVLSTIYLHNPNMDLDIQTNDVRLTLYNNIDNQNPGATYIMCETAGTFEFAGSTALELDGNDFLNNSIYNLDLDNSSTITLADFLYIKNNLRMSGAAPTIDIVDNDFIIEGNISYTSGEIDATDNLGQFTVAGTGAFNMPTYFTNNEVSNLLITRNGTVNQNGAVDVDASFTLNNAGAIYDLNSNTLTIENTFTPTAGQIDAQDNGSAFVIANGVSTTAYSGDDFVNNTINELYVYNGVTLNNDFIIEDLLNIENGNSNFQGTNVEIQGDVTLDNTGGIQTTLTNSMTFSNTSNLTNNSNGNINLNNVFVTGTLNSTASPSIGGNFDVSGVSNFTSGTVTFDNSASKTITNTGTLDFNYLNIGSGSDVRTTSSFDINNDFRMVDNTSVFLATTPSNITFAKDGLNIFAQTNSNGTSAGLTFFEISFTSGFTTNFKGAFDFYINDNINANNSFFVFDDNSTLILTSSTGNTNFGIFTIDNLTFESTANYNWYCDSRISGTVTVEAGGQTNMFLNRFNNTPDATLINQAPNTSSNLQLYEITLTNSVLTTDDSFRLNNWIEIDASSTLTQTSGTFTKGNGAITNNGEMTINEFEIIGTPTTTTDMIISGNYYLQNPVNSFTASAGSITFTNPNLEIINAGTTQFFDLYFDNAVTSGTTDDNFTIAGELELGATALFTASSPSEITLSGNGSLNCPTSAVGGNVGLFFHDVDFTGNYSTNAPVANQVIFEVSGSMNVDGSFNGNTNTEILFTGAGAETITNNGTLDFNTVTINNGNYTTATDFNVKNLFTVNLGNSFEATAGTIYLTATSSSISSNVADMNDFKFNNIGVSAANAFASNSFTVAGDVNVNNNSNFTHSTGEIRFVDGGTHNITNSGNLIFNDFSIEDNNLVQTSSDFTVKSDQFDLLGSSSSFNAIDGQVSFVVNSSSATITSGGGLGSVIFHDLLIDDAKSLYIEEDLDIIVQGDFRAGLAVNLFTEGNTNFYFNGGAQQIISVENGSEINFQNLTLNNSSGLKLNEDIAVEELNVYKNLTLTDGDLDLFGNNIITFQKPLAHLYEEGGILKNSIDNIGELGHLYYEYDFTTILNNLDFAGLGIGFRQAAGAGIMGLTTIKRYHTSNEIAGGTSIQRLFSIESPNNNLRARPIIDYYDSEIIDVERAKEDLILSSTRTIGELWAAINTKNISVSNRLEALDTINEFGGFNTIWTAVVPIRLTLSEVEDRVDLSQVPNNRFIAGTTEHNILGFNVSSTNDTEITDLKIYVEDNKRQFINFKLYTSDDEFFDTKNDNELIGSIQYANDSLDFNVGELILSSTKSINFFLSADISDSVTIFSDSVLVYINQSGISLNLNQGIVNLKVVGDIYYKFQQRIDVEFNPIGLNSTPLLPNTFNNVIYGFNLKPLGNEAGLNEFELYFKNSPLNSVAGRLKLYKSVDNNYLTFNDNSEIELFQELSISDNQSYVFNFNEDIIPETGRFYFITVDSVSNFANDGTIDMQLGIPQQSLKSERAAPIAVDTVYGDKFSFESLKTQIISTTDVAEGLIYKNGRLQNLYGFTIENNNIAEFKKLIVNFSASGGLSPSQHFNNIILWSDNNENNSADNNELIAIGRMSTDLIVFENFINKVEFSGQKKFLITANISSNAPENSQIILNIPNESYVSFNPPSKVESGGPFLGNKRTIKIAKLPVEIEISKIYPSFIKSGNSLDVTIKLLDEDGVETIANSQYPINLTFLGSVTSSGNSTSNFIEGESFITISGYKLTNINGATPVSIRANNNSFTSALSNTFTVYPLQPTTNSSDLVLSSGNPATGSINIDSWTNGSGTNRIIVARAGSVPNSPTDGENYIAESNAINSEISTNQTAPGSFVIYNGSGGSIPFSFNGLLPGIKYYFKVYDFILFNGKPVYLSEDSNPVYVFQTSDDGTSTLNNNTSDDAITIFENTLISGTIVNNTQEDWYKFKTNGNNILVNSCGEFLFIDLFKFNPTTNTLRLIRRTQNTGENCQIIILNDDDGEEYYIRVSRLKNTQSADYQFKFRTYNYELFSRKVCDCP